MQNNQIHFGYCTQTKSIGGVFRRLRNNKFQGWFELIWIISLPICLILAGISRYFVFENDNLYLRMIMANGGKLEGDTICVKFLPIAYSHRLLHYQRQQRKQLTRGLPKPMGIILKRSLFKSALKFVITESYKDASNWFSLSAEIQKYLIWILKKIQGSTFFISVWRVRSIMAARSCN